MFYSSLAYLAKLYKGTYSGNRYKIQLATGYFDERFQRLPAPSVLIKAPLWLFSLPTGLYIIEGISVSQ